MKSELEALMNRHIEDAGLITPTRHYMYHAGRKWEFDFAWPGILGVGFIHSLALEVEGGSWVKGRHTTGVGFQKDAEKYLAANEHGWLVLRVTGSQIKSGEAIQSLQRVMLRGESVIPTKSCHLVKVRARAAGTTSMGRTGKSDTLFARSATKKKSVAAGRQGVSTKVSQDPKSPSRRDQARRPASRPRRLRVV